MTANIPYLMILSFSVALLSFFMRQHHILAALMNLEALLLFVIVLITFNSHHQHSNLIFLVIILLTMSVCSASIGLSLMITSCRNDGNDSTNVSALTLC